MSPNEPIPAPSRLGAPAILVVTAHPEHRKTVIRVEGLSAAGASVAVAGYERDGAKDIVSVRHTFHSLGQASKGNFLARALRLPRAAARLVSLLRNFDRCDYLWAASLDTLVIALIARLFAHRRARIIYDVADLLPLQLEAGLRGRILRWAEWLACRGVDILVVTSPWFYWRHYRALLPRRTRAFLLENKLLPPAPSVDSPSPGPPWRILWNGYLRCPTSLAIAEQVSHALPDAVEFHAWGLPWGPDAEAMGEALGAAAARLGNFHYHGGYSDAAIDHIFTGAHFIFGFDLSDGLNSFLLLPNRLYQGAARALPILAPSETALGESITALELGATISAPYSNTLIQFFRALNGAQYEAMRAKISPARRCAAVFSTEYARFLKALEHGGSTLELPADENTAVVLSA